MGRSPESPYYPLCPCPTPIEQASEALELDQLEPPPSDATNPIPPLVPTNRRKSSTWKGFNLKRQLSKVDMKLKNPLKDKRNSIFYSEVAASSPPESKSPSSPDSDDNTIVDNRSVIDLDQIGSGGGDGVGEFYMLPIDDDENTSSRPDNLDLGADVDIEEDYPVRPPRNVKKTKMTDKRNNNERLLSVPNVKYQKAELIDLRDKEENVSAVSPQPSFTGNLMRRFSKCQLCETKKKKQKYPTPLIFRKKHPFLIVPFLLKKLFLDVLRISRFVYFSIIFFLFLFKSRFFG